MLKPEIIVAISILALVVGTPVLCESNQAKMIEPLKAESEFQQHKDAGTTETFLLRPVGYKPRKNDKRSARGRSLYDKLSCAQCHAINGQGGELGPPLDGIGGHRGREWLVARLLDPAKQMREFPEMFGGKPNVMPHPGVSRKEAELISDYLLTLPEPDGGFAVAHHKIAQEDEPPSSTSDWQPQPETEASRNGRELFADLRCAACHSLDGSKDRFGPDLAGIGSRVSAKRLEKILSGAVRSSVMTAQTKTLGEERIFDLKAFLLTLPAVSRKEPSTDKKD